MEFDATPAWDAAAALGPARQTMQVLFGAEGRVEGSYNPAGRASVAIAWPVAHP
jgi:hypothetical protein